MEKNLPAQLRQWLTTTSSPSYGIYNPSTTPTAPESATFLDILTKATESMYTHTQGKLSEIPNLLLRTRSLLRNLTISAKFLPLSRPLRIASPPTYASILSIPTLNPCAFPPLPHLPNEKVMRVVRVLLAAKDLQNYLDEVDVLKRVNEIAVERLVRRTVSIVPITTSWRPRARVRLHRHRCPCHQE